MMRKISQAAVNLWGIEAQMLMVGEEASELDKAVHKWWRAWKKYNEKGISLTRSEDEIENLEDKAHQRYLEKTIKDVKTEAMQVFFLIDQLQVMLPGDYESILEDVLKDATNLLRQRGVEI